jgi:hypothetical protein
MVGAGSHGNHAERALAATDNGGAGRVEADHEGEQRARGPGEASDGSAGGGWRAVVFGSSPGGGVSESGRGHVPGATVQSGRAWGAEDRGRARSSADLRPAGAGADRGDSPAVSRAEGRWDSNLVALDAGANAPARGAPAGGRRRFGGCCTTRAVRTSGRGRGVRRGRRSASARQAWSRWLIRRRKKKGGHRPGVPASRGGRSARLVPG